MRYEIVFPPNYVKPVLPGRNDWTSPLRSGMYRQARGVLCDGDGYCCLGVLSKTQVRLKKYGLAFYYDARSDCNSLPAHCGLLNDDNPSVQCGAISPRGMFPAGVIVRVFGVACTCLTQVNDDAASGEEERARGDVACTCLTQVNDYGLTFSEIADIIEAVWDHAPRNW